MEQMIDSQDLKKLDISKDGSVILFGNTHGFIDDLTIQEFLISSIMPEYYLFELLEDAKISTKTEVAEFMNKISENAFSMISTNEEIQEVLGRLMKYNLKFIGCDLKNLGRKSKSELMRTSLTPNEEAEEERLLEERENHQARVVRDILKITTRPVFISVGAYHLRKNSHLLRALSGLNVYLARPIYEGEELYEPKEGIQKDKIRYELKSIA